MSKLRVQEIAHTNGTVAATVNSSGVLSSPGHVLQVKYATYGTQVNTTSTTYVDLVSIDITPSSASSKFYMIANFMWSGRGTLNLFRDSTQLHSHGADPYVMWGYNQSNWNSNSMRTMATQTCLDSPATTSQITYWVKYRARSATAVDAAGINEVTSGSTMSNFMVMEIAA